MILKIEIKEYTERYIKICTLFDSILSLSRTLSDKMSMEIIDKLEIIIKKLQCHVGSIYDYLPK